MPKSFNFKGRPNANNGGEFRDAVDLEDTVKAFKIQQSKHKRVKKDAQIAAKEAKKRALVTLPSIDSLNKFMGRK